MGAGSTPPPAGGDDGCADAVLLLGPLYHLTGGEDRVAASREARRVVAPNGVVCGAVISRFASTWDGPCWRFLDEPGFEEIVERDVAEGIHLNPTRRPDCSPLPISTGPKRPPRSSLRRLGRRRSS